MLPLQGLSAIEILHALVVVLVLLPSVTLMLTVVAVAFLVIRDGWKARKDKRCHAPHAK